MFFKRMFIDLCLLRFTKSSINNSLSINYKDQTLIKILIKTYFQIYINLIISKIINIKMPKKIKFNSLIKTVINDKYK